MADSPSRVGFLCDGQLSSEQEAALRWLRGTEATVEERTDAIEYLMELAEQRGTETKFISTDFEKGEQLY
ncbi:MAG: hypothetical protein KGY43_05140, partial [Halodesulfurarchaeum sp.]|nr:hypothetical protein [Halodesulfurarchaeum sp.]